jgi:poly-gamma-glutamate synthesis protein (capsule biosynthesis protein)
MAMTMPGTFTLTSVGDLIIRRPASQLADAGLQAAIDLIRDADLAVGNLEGSLSNMRQFDGPMNNFMGSHEVAADLKAMGFDMVNRANNHLFDSEAAGMFATNALLDEAGVAHAGTGENLDTAAAPVFLELPPGRVAMVGMHTPTFVIDQRLAATHRRGNLGGRPGLNMLRYTESILLSPEQLASLRQVRDQLLEHQDNYDNPRPVPANEGSDRLRFPASNSGREDPTYRATGPGEIPGTVDYAINEADRTRILRSIRSAKQYADFVVATMHAHQGQSVLERMHFSTQPPDFYVDLAHQAIDNGADAFVGHGVQTLRGVEIYNGKPIFYGLGEFFREGQWTLDVQTGMTDPTPRSTRQAFARSFGGTSESLESVVAVSRYEDGNLAEIRLYPTELGVDRPDSRLGIPRIAPPDIGQRILERIQRLSRALGTTIEIDGNTGVIRF